MESDVCAAYLLGANSFITKPDDLGSFVELLRLIYEYWSLCECPPTGIDSAAKAAS